MGSWACPPSWRKRRPKKGISGNHALNELATCRLVTLFGIFLDGISGRGGLSGRGLSGLVGDRRSLDEKGDT